MAMDRDKTVAGLVTGAAFLASAQHIWRVTADMGNPGVIAALHPLAIDGLIYIGIRALQDGRRRSGGFALAYGAGYSLAFNAASYRAFPMPVLAMAACLPLAFLAAVLIVHGRGHASVPIERVVEYVERPLLPIVPFVRPVQVDKVKVDKVRPVSGGPAVQWDMDKVVDMILRGEPSLSVQDACGVSAKTVQRTTRVVRAIASGQPDTAIVRGDMTAKFVQAVRKIMEDK